ncbi:DUF5994 family protein [Streptomyces sp. NPDC054933]
MPPLGITPLAPARLCLLPSDTGPCRIDGTWRPRSRDLALELPRLLGELDGRWGRVTRVTVNRSMWSPIPSRILFADRVVHLGWFRTGRNPQTICLVCPGIGRWDLTVLPPETGFFPADASGARDSHTPEA